MLKRISTILLTLMLALSVVGCKTADNKGVDQTAKNAKLAISTEVLSEAEQEVYNNLYKEKYNELYEETKVTEEEIASLKDNEYYKRPQKAVVIKSGSNGDSVATYFFTNDEMSTSKITKVGDKSPYGEVTEIRDLSDEELKGIDTSYIKSIKVDNAIREQVKAEVTK